MTGIDLTPWSYRHEPSRRILYRAIMPATGHYAALISWEGPESPITIWWEPIVCWAIKTFARDKNKAHADVDSDQVVPLSVGEVDALDEIDWTHVSNGFYAGIYTEVDKESPKVREALLNDAEGRRRRMLDEQQQDEREHQQIHAFVRAQPDPAGFARSMRVSARSRRHAWLAIHLAGGDPKQAIENSRVQLWVLEKARRQAEASAEKSP